MKKRIDELVTDIMTVTLIIFAFIGLISALGFWFHYNIPRILVICSISGTIIHLMGKKEEKEALE